MEVFVVVMWGQYEVGSRVDSVHASMLQACAHVGENFDVIDNGDGCFDIRNADPYNDYISIGVEAHDLLD